MSVLNLSAASLPLLQPAGPGGGYSAQNSALAKTSIPMLIGAIVLTIFGISLAALVTSL